MTRRGPRRALFTAALVCFAAAVLLEAALPGTAALRAPSAALQSAVAEAGGAPATEVATPPGRAIRELALLDGVLLVTLLLMGASLLIPAQAMGRVQGLATVVAMFVVIVLGLVTLFIALVELLLMVGLLLSPPFGTIAYLAIYAGFPRGLAGAILAGTFALKLAAGALLLASRPFLARNLGLVLLFLTCLLGSWLIGFLHGLVPLFLVSVLDAVAAIVIAILALIWALVHFIAGIPAAIRGFALQR